jgi:hypothetical protein
MISLADYATSRAPTPEFLFQMLPNVLNTIASLHSVRFPYLDLSPFSIIVDDTFSFRPPALNPFASPKSLLPPRPKLHRSKFRSANEIRFYQAPEWNSIPPFCSPDSWSFRELLILGGPLFESLSRDDQKKRTQMILGRAPPFLQCPSWFSKWFISGFSVVIGKYTKTIEINSFRLVIPCSLSGLCALGSRGSMPVAPI